MMTLYRQHVLGEKPATGGFVPLHSVAPASSTPAEQKPELREEVLETSAKLQTAQNRHGLGMTIRLQLNDRFQHLCPLELVLTNATARAFVVARDIPQHLAGEGDNVRKDAAKNLCLRHPAAFATLTGGAVRLPPSGLAVMIRAHGNGWPWWFHGAVISLITGLMAALITYPSVIPG